MPGAYRSNSIPRVPSRAPFEHSKVVVSHAFSRSNGLRRSLGEGRATLKENGFLVRISPLRPIAFALGDGSSGAWLILTARSVSILLVGSDRCSSLRATFSYFTPLA